MNGKPVLWGVILKRERTGVWESKGEVKQMAKKKEKIFLCSLGKDKEDEGKSFQS